jgi:hypothetical protein
LNRELDEDTAAAPKQWKLFAQRLIWPTIYAVTVAGLFWWFQVRPVWKAKQTLQGTWQFVEGTGPDETGQRSYLDVQGDKKQFVYRRAGSETWDSRQEKYRLHRANDFFVLTRVQKLKNTREFDLVVRISDDKLYLVRGVVPLDPSLDRTIQKARRVNRLPAEATK